MYPKARIVELKKILLFLFVFLFPLNLSAKQFFVKMSFGVLSGGDVEDTVLAPAEYIHLISMGEEKRSSLGQDVYLEFIYQINPYISLSLGTGYTSKMIKGAATQFTPPETSIVEGGFTLSPEFASEAIPFCCSVIFSFPLSTSFRVNFTGGVGYYFGTFEGRSEWKAPSFPGFTSWEYRSWNFNGKANAIGYHAGAGADIDISWNMLLSVDVFYKTINFNNIRSSGEVGDDTTFFYLRFYEAADDFTYLDYRVSRVSLSGFSLRAGFKFKF